MWREQLDAFWDGEGALVIGFFDAVERGPALGARPELLVVAARDPSFSAGVALVDVLDAARWRCGHCLIEVPKDHLFLSLRAPDGAELRLALLDRDAPGGEWRLLSTLLPDAGGAAPASFRVAALSARGDFERLAREQIVQSGARLVWAFGQRRALERRDGALRLAQLWPARRVFPALQSRIVLEAGALDDALAPDAREAPFAIMDHWLRENGAPRVSLRLRVPDSLDESAAMLNRASVVLVMSQRRRLRDWMREQRDAGEPIIDPLTFDDLRHATGEPTEHPDAVEPADAIVVGNLLRLIASPEEVECDGFVVRRIAEAGSPGLGAALDIDFYGAALGDEVGLVGAAADAGDFGVAPLDPGGAPYVRLFRVEADGLKPRRVAEDDSLLDEILRRAAQEDHAPTGAMTRSLAERAASLYGRREKLAASINGVLSRAEFEGRFEAAGAWEIFEPLSGTSFAALVSQASAAERAALQRIGGYAAYRADPSVAALLMRRPALANCAQAPLARAADRDRPPLLRRLALALDAEGLVPADADFAAQQRLLRVLTELEHPERMLAARLTLSGAAQAAEVMETADALQDAAVVERAAEHLSAAGHLAEAEALRGYLDLRREGGWIALEEAMALAPLILRALAEWEAAAAAEIETPPEPAPRKGFFGAVRGLFGFGGATPQG